MAETSGWAINGPVKTPVEDARRLAYGLSGDGHGLARLNDLRALPTDPPGGAVQVVPGSCLIKSRYADGETYLASLNEPTTLAVTPTPSNRSRADLVVFEVLDPWAANSPVPEPEDPAAFEYFKLHIIENVDAALDVKNLHDVPGYANRTGIVLDRLNLPANRADVQASMINRIAIRHTPQERTRYLYYALSGDEVNSVTATTPFPQGQTWPAQAETQGDLDLDIPDWATHAAVKGDFEGVLFASGDAVGSVWLQIGRTDNPYNVKSQDTRWDTANASNAERRSIGFAARVAIPPQLRGTRQRFYPRATRTKGSNVTTAKMDRVSSVALTITFQG